jgi:hypothetical protein
VITWDWRARFLLVAASTGTAANETTMSAAVTAAQAFSSISRLLQ